MKWPSLIGVNSLLAVTITILLSIFSAPKLAQAGYSGGSQLWEYYNRSDRERLDEIRTTLFQITYRGQRVFSATPLAENIFLLEFKEKEQFSKSQIKKIAIQAIKEQGKKNLNLNCNRLLL